MKKIILIILILLESLLVINVNAIDCHPAYTGNWTATESCTWPDGYKVNGNIYVGTYVITMGVGDDMGIDLSTKKITFSTGKITIDATAKIANHVTTRYYLGVSYSTAGTGTDCDTGNGGTQCTACPAGMHVFNNNSGVAPNQTGTTAYMGTTPKTMATSGTFYCGTKGT